MSTPQLSLGIKLRDDARFDNFHGDRNAGAASRLKVICDRPETVPVVVDRAGNLLGYFTANVAHPGRVRDAYLLWIVDRHHWIVENLDAVRAEFAP